MNLRKIRRNVLAAWLAAGGALGSAYAGTYTNDFSTASMTGLTFNGGVRDDGVSPYPAIENGHLSIVHAENSKQGTVILDDLDPAKAIESFKMNFKLRIGGGSSTPADGLAIFFGQVDGTANFGEEGPTIENGLTIAFDIYDNGGGEAPAIDIKANNVVIGHFARTIQEITSDAFTDVAIELKRNGTLSLSYKGQQLYNNIFLPGYAPAAGDRFAIGARTGGLNANQWIDDLGINTVEAVPTAPSFTAPPASVTVAEGASTTFTAGFDGSAPISFQWLSNNVEIAEATGATYTLPFASASANGAKFKVVATNPTGSATSAEATLTVTSDTVKPTIVSVSGNGDFNGVLVTFSEPVTEATASNPANYSLSGGLTISAVTVVSPTKVLLTTSAQTPGTSFTLTVNGVQDLALTPNTIEAASTKTFSSFVLSKGFVKFEYYFGTGIGGTAVDDLLNSTNYAGLPDMTAFISALNTRLIFPDDSHENYGAKVSGFIVPTETADYRFFISSDDASRMLLAADGDVANLAVVAEETGCCNGFTEPGTARTSEPITLTAGTAYPFVAFVKEGGGGDYLSIAWRKESDTTPAGTLQPIPSSFLATYADPGPVAIAFTTQPTSRTASENTRTTFTAAATGSPAPLVLQWQRQAPGATTFSDIPGANSASYTSPVLKQSIDNGAKYRVVALVPGGSMVSAEATLTVNVDSTAPMVASATAGDNQKSVTLKFSEDIDTVTGAVAANYTIPGLTVSAAVVKGDSVVLTTSAQTAGTVYTVTVAGVKDSAQNNVDPAHNTGTFTAVAIQAGVMKFEAYFGITGTAVSGLLASPKYPNAPDYRQLMATFEAPYTFSDNYGGRMTGFVTPPEDGDYRFFIASDDASVLYVSTDDSAANLPTTPTARELGCCQGFVEPGETVTVTSAPIRLLKDRRYYVVYITKEGGGGDNGKVGWRLEGDDTPANTLPAIPGKYLAAALPPSVLNGYMLKEGTAVGTGTADKPGFKARIHQVNEAGGVTAATSIDRAEQQLAGLLGPNVANLAGATDGVFTIPGTLNWNEAWDTGEVGSFTSGGDPSRPDTAIPGIPGTGAALNHNLDNIAGEVTTFVEFPAAGVYYMGINSDDGFNVTSSGSVPANNSALVVSAPASVAGSYHLLSPNQDTSAFPALTAPISGKLVYASPGDGCAALTNPDQIRGNIALIDRGVCTFSAKAQAALDAGAIACIIINSRDPGSSDGPFPSLMTGTFVNIPTFMMFKTDGALLKAAVGDLMISITPDPTPVLGQFRTGRGATDSIFPVIVPAAGVYPMRAIWFEGGGGANFEWFSVNAEGAKVLLNDREVPSALKTYTARTGGTVTPTLSIAKSGANVVITFTGHLYASDTVDGPYTLVAGEGSISVTPAGTSKFYRAGP
jgi:hypothetical protein